MLTGQKLIEKLKNAGLRPTRQRVALADLLFGKKDRHVSAEILFEEAKRSRISVSLATVYNTLNQFTNAGLLRAISVDCSRIYFDTKTADHHHFFFEDSEELLDIPEDRICVENLPSAPNGTEISQVDVIIRIRSVRQLL